MEWQQKTGKEDHKYAQVTLQLEIGKAWKVVM